MDWMYPELSEIKLELMTTLQKLRNLINYMIENENMKMLFFSDRISKIRIDLINVQRMINFHTVRDSNFSDHFQVLKNVLISLTSELWDIERKILGVNKLRTVIYENWEIKYNNNELRKPLIKLLKNSENELQKLLDTLIKDY